MAAASVIPEGYTFLNPETLITTGGKALADDLRKKADGRDPDAFDMYIYNDFFGYAVLDLVDTTLLSLHGKVVKKKYDEAYSILEGLTIFMDFEGQWTQIDDGDRVKLTNKAYGALAVAVLKGLKKESRLDKASFPSLECLLESMSVVAEMMEGCGCKCVYGKVARNIARRLFNDKSEADFALEQKQREEWFNALTDMEEKEAMAPGMNDRADWKKAKAEAWFVKGAVFDEDKRNSDLSYTPVWKEYRDYLQEVPSGPMRGPCWDISEWEEFEKKPFQFKFMGDDDEDMY
ncbi:hypothetical protein D9611_002577 [Ephemerocybe angulata]|uniref:Uncharacterized protein n=1 Tax=Ephemerocybe angulata TaxID=980116 RepID=A0A8H5C3I5_9AGAR|nr:hypothetical protein D9611_002577 [Tulosesus angulatus]